MSDTSDSEQGATSSEADNAEADREAALEREHERARREIIHETVGTFLDKLLKGLQTRNVSEIYKLYEEDYNKCTDKYFKSSRWPSAEAVKVQVSDEPLFLILYKELYYRHIFTKSLNTTFEDRKYSWENYCQLLELIIADFEDNESSMALPAQWLWDILDEFIYHYQTYAMFRTKAARTQKEKEVNMIKENTSIFDTTKVLHYLHQLVRHSLIEEYLTSPGNPNGVATGAFADESARYIGYFSLMQLLRMHSLLGDYRLALQTIGCIDFATEVPLFYKIPACHVTLFYYMGFAYLMQRRYVDAIRVFSDILVFLSKTSGVNSLSYQYDTMVKKQDQMYALLLICLALCPRSVDETIDKHIRDKLADKQARLQRGEASCFEELFSYACPKFITAALPDFDNVDKDGIQSEAIQRQLHLFKREVEEQRFLPRIASYMKLYTAIKVSKLAALCDKDEEDLRDQLMCVMHKMRQPVHRVGAPLNGDLEPCSEVEFYLDGDMVHINAHKSERAHADVFLEQILKFQDLLRKSGRD